MNDVARTILPGMEPDPLNHLGDVIKFHRDGIPWQQAPIPPPDHRCSPQTEMHHHFDVVYICACGASATPNAPRWTNRNTRRRPMTIGDEFHTERERAHQKHRDKPGGSMEMKNWDEPDWSDVLTEELGEASRARNDYRHGLLTLDDYRTQLRKELIQLGAMTEAWIAAIDNHPTDTLRHPNPTPTHGDPTP